MMYGQFQAFCIYSFGSWSIEKDYVFLGILLSVGLWCFIGEAVRAKKSGFTEWSRVFRRERESNLGAGIASFLTALVMFSIQDIKLRLSGIFLLAIPGMIFVVILNFLCYRKLQKRIILVDTAWILLLYISLITLVVIIGWIGVGKLI